MNKINFSTHPIAIILILLGSAGNSAYNAYLPKFIQAIHGSRGQGAGRRSRDQILCFMLPTTSSLTLATLGFGVTWWGVT